jgi:adenine deaminase
VIAGAAPDPVAAALGERPFDLLLAGGVVADVATGELREADVGLAGGWIASVHPRGARRDARETHDVSGRFLAPGFIDSHLHFESSLMAPADYASVVVPQGTTTAVWDPHEIANVAGLPGLRWAADAARGLPLRVLLAAPSCVPSAPGLEVGGAEFGADEVAEMLRWPDVAGVAEVMDMQGLLGADPRMRGIVAAGVAAGANVNGHARGLTGARLQGYAAAGVTSDHEITSPADLLEKLRAGLTVELRGSHDDVLAACVPVLATLPLLPATLVLCTDDIWPDDLVAKGGLRDTIARVIARGMSPVAAIRCATLHAALRLKRDDLGLVAPGRRAEILVLSDLAGVVVERVYVGGALAAERGALLAPPPRGLEAAPRGTVKLAPLADDALALRVRGVTNGRARLRTVRGARFTSWGEAEVRVQGGIAEPPPGHSLLAILHRHGRADAAPRVALVEGWGELDGAIATTIAHDSHNLLVFGRDAAEMALAANTVIASGGGLAVVQRGAALAQIALPICGLIAETAPAETARALAAVREAAGRVVAWELPHRSFRGLTGVSLACNPGPHATDRGIADGTTREVFDPAEAL